MNKSFAYGVEDARNGRKPNPYFHGDNDYAAGYAQGKNEVR